MTIPTSSLMLIIKENQKYNKSAESLESHSPKQTKKETPRTLKKIKSSENFIKYQWAWIL
jgi:hypothetical protein